MGPYPGADPERYCEWKGTWQQEATCHYNTQQNEQQIFLRMVRFILIIKLGKDTVSL